MYEEKKEVIGRLLELAEKLEKNGTLEILETLSDLSTDAISYLTDPRILRIGSNVSFMLHVLEMIDPTLLTVMFNNFWKEFQKEMNVENMKDPPKVGLLGILRMLSDEDVQRALGFMFLFLKAFGRSLEVSSKQLLSMMENVQKQMEEMRRKREELGI